MNQSIQRKVAIPTAEAFGHDRCRQKRWLGEFAQSANWNFCLKAARMAAVKGEKTLAELAP